MQHIIQPESSIHLSFKHYPILSAFFKEYGLFKLFDSILPKKLPGQASHSQCILLFVCESLTSQTPYSEYSNLLANLDIEMIFGPDVAIEHFSDRVTEETLDAIEQLGASRLFSLVFEHIRDQVRIDMTHLHSDTIPSSISAEYDDDGTTHSGLRLILGPVKGNHAEIKRWTLMMIVNAQGIPVAIKTLEENSKGTSITEESEVLQVALSSIEATDSIFVTDGTFYTKSTIGSFYGKWISNVPDKLPEVKHYKEMKGLSFAACQDKDYKVYGFDSSYGGVAQRWVLVHSQQMFSKQKKTLLRNQEKQLQEACEKTKHLHSQTFSSEGDALAASTSLIDRWPLLKALEPEVRVWPSDKVEKKGEELKLFSVSVTFVKDPASLEEACSRIGKFMLATNDLSLEDEQVLYIYKNQQSIVHGFRFLKDGNLHLSPLFLKKPDHIEALSFVICFSHMVNAIIENQLREALSENNETIHIQDAGPSAYRDNARPTLTKIFALFAALGTTMITVPGGDQLLIRSSLPPETRKVLHLLGPSYVQAFE